MESTEKTADHGSPLTIDKLLDSVQAGSPHLGDLATLMLWSNQISDVGLRALTAGALPRLSRLDLSGNAIGDTGNSPTDAIVDGADVLGAQSNQTATAAIINLYDFNRDKVVDATDVAFLRSSIGIEPSTPTCIRKYRLMMPRIENTIERGMVRPGSRISAPRYAVVL